MRSILAAAALCLPAIVSAQAVHSVSHVLAAAEAPAFAFQTSAIKAGLPRVFTGLIAPVRLTSLNLLPVSAPAGGEVVVTYTVNSTGVPEDVQVVTPVGHGANASVVVEAVRKLRYTPGQLDGQAVAVPVTLHIAFTR